MEGSLSREFIGLSLPSLSLLGFDFLFTAGFSLLFVCLLSQTDDTQSDVCLTEASLSKTPVLQSRVLTLHCNVFNRACDNKMSYYELLHIFHFSV